MENVISFNDGLLPGGRNPRLVIVDNKGNIYKFTGKTVPGVFVVLTETYEKNGKWSNTTYTIKLAQGVRSVNQISPIHGSYWQDCPTLEDAYIKFGQSIGGKSFDRNQFNEFLKKYWEKAYERMLEEGNQIDQLINQTDSEVELFNVEVAAPYNQPIIIKLNNDKTVVYILETVYTNDTQYKIEKEDIPIKVLEIKEEYIRRNKIKIVKIAAPIGAMVEVEYF